MTKKTQKVTLEYNGFYFTMKTGEFKKCAFGSLVNKLNKTVIEGVNDICSQEEWMLKFFVNPEDATKYSKGSGEKINVICPNCNTIKNNKMIIHNLYRYKSIGCQKCGDGISYPTKFCFNLLEQLNLNFKTEYSPDWLESNMRYDFYIPSFNLIIEMDGNFHNSDSRFKITDEYKNSKAKENNVRLIRIDSSKSNLEFIKSNILDSSLSNIFDLSRINWLKIEEFCLSTRIKEVCDLWENGMKQVSKIVSTTGLCKSTVCRYLNKGKKLGWCDYDPDYEKKKNWSVAGVKTGIKYSKNVEIFKEGKSLGVFKSCRDLEEKCENLFGVKLSNKHISGVCNGRRKTHKGFTFKHI